MGAEDHSVHCLLLTLLSRIRCLEVAQQPVAPPPVVESNRCSLQVEVLLIQQSLVCIRPN